MADSDAASKYFRRFGFDDEAISEVELLPRASTGIAREYLLGFIQRSGFWSLSTQSALEVVAADTSTSSDARLTTIQILADHGAQNTFFVSLLADQKDDVASQALNVVVERQHRAMIERSLARLLEDEELLRAEETRLPFHSEIAWVGKVRSDFAWRKLAMLRKKALTFELDRLCQFFTGVLGSLDSSRAACRLRAQMRFTP